MSRRERGAGRPRRVATGLALAVSLSATGCGQPGEGTVHFSPEARARMLPHTAPNAKDRKGRPIGNRPIGYKALLMQKAMQKAASSSE